MKVPVVGLASIGTLSLSGCLLYSGASVHCTYPRGASVMVSSLADHNFQEILTSSNGSVITGQWYSTGSATLEFFRLPGERAKSNTTLADWTRPLSVALEAGITDWVSSGFATATNGDVYAVGSGWNGANTVVKWRVYRSQDNGVSWSPTSTYTGSDIAGGLGSNADSLFINPYNGRIIVGATVRVGAVRHGVIQSSMDRGVTWSRGLDETGLGGARQVITDIAMAPNGTVYALLSGEDAGAIWSGLLLKSVDGGATFSRVRALPSRTVGKNTYYQHLVADSRGTLWLGRVDEVGAGNDAYVTILKSSDDGATLTSSDTDFYLSPSQGASSAYHGSMAEDSEGRIFWSGQLAAAGGIYHGIVRMTSNQGLTWTTVADSVGDTGEGAWYYRMHISRSGDLWMAGGQYISGVEQGAVFRVSCN